MNTLLTLLDEVPKYVRDKDAENVMKIIFISVIAALILLVAVISFTNAKSKFDTRSIVYGGMCVAMSFALSFIKWRLFPNGGSITLISALPLFLYCYTFGVGKGAVAGTIYGLLQFVEGSFFLTVPQFFLDYIIAFAAICLASVFKRVFKNKMASVLCGALLFSLVRLASHVGAGITVYYAYIDSLTVFPIFGAGGQFPAFVYSLIYNSFYMIPETIILCVTLAVLVKTKAFHRLTKMMTAHRVQIEPAAAVDTQNAD